MKLTLEDAVIGMLDAESKLSSREALVSPHLISENMYRLGQYASAVEKHLGEIEEELEIKQAEVYMRLMTEGKSATGAKQAADAETAALKGQIKKLSRYVSSSWRIHTGAMARWNHIISEQKGAV